MQHDSGSLAYICFSRSKWNFDLHLLVVTCWFHSQSSYDILMDLRTKLYSMYYVEPCHQNNAGLKWPMVFGRILTRCTAE